MLGEGRTDDIDSRANASEKKFSINFSKRNKKISFSWQYNVKVVIAVIYSLLKNKSVSLKPIIKM